MKKRTKRQKLCGGDAVSGSLNFNNFASFLTKILFGPD